MMSTIPDDLETSSTRTEVEVAADTLAALISAGLLRPHQHERAASAAGIMMGELAAAVARRKMRGDNPPRRRTVELHPQPPPKLTVVPEAAPTTKQRTRRAWNVRQPEPEATEFGCSRCHETKPIEQFSWRSDNKHLRWTVCDDCRRERGRMHYLSVGKLKAMNAARLTFTVATGDNMVGLTCLDCGHKFRVGDVVHGETGLRHEACPERKP